MLCNFFEVLLFVLWRHGGDSDDNVNSENDEDNDHYDGDEDKQIPIIMTTAKTEKYTNHKDLANYILLCNDSL